MDEWLPIIIVIATIALLWVVGKYISKLSETLETVVPTPAIPKGKIFADGLHVSDMSNVLIREAQEIITRQDENELSYFIARYRPHFVELEEYLAGLRSQFFTKLGKPSNLASEADKINAVNNLDLNEAPTCIDMSAIDSGDMRHMIERTLKSSNKITSEFMESFGGSQFYENFQVYTQLANQQNVSLHIPPDHQYRKHMEIFVETGIALQGRKIPLKERLEVLSFNQLKEMATELKVNKQFTDKSEIASTLAQMPGSTVHLAMIYKQEDIFYMNADPVDVKSIEEEWALVRAYSRLLIGSLKNSYVSFDEEAII
ncbi:hypothetical protein [Kaarinaea lacus]